RRRQRAPDRAPAPADPRAVSLPPVFTASACLLHDPGRFHPEAPSRLEIVRAHVAAADPNALRQAAPASREALLRVHPEEYLKQLETLAAAGGGRLDPDTALNAASWDAA